MKYKKILKIIAVLVVLFTIFVYQNPFYWGMKALPTRTKQPDEIGIEKDFLDSVRETCKCNVSRYYYNYKKENPTRDLKVTKKNYNYELTLASSSKNNFLKNPDNFFLIAKKIAIIENNSSLLHIYIYISTIDKMDTGLEEGSSKSYKYLYNHNTKSISLENFK